MQTGGHMTDQETRDRLLRVEMRLDHAVATQTETKTKVDEMHTILVQARGAKWVALMLLTTIASAAGYIGHAIQVWLNPPPQ